VPPIDIRSPADVLLELLWWGSPASVPSLRNLWVTPDSFVTAEGFEPFVRLFQESVSALRSRLERDPLEIAPREVGPHSVMFWMDAVFAQHLEALGPRGKEEARRVREFSDRNWEGNLATRDQIGRAHV